MDVRQAIRRFLGSHDRLLDNVSRTHGRSCCLHGIQFELRLIRRVGPEEEQCLAAVECGRKRFLIAIVNRDSFDISGTCGFRRHTREWNAARNGCLADSSLLMTSVPTVPLAPLTQIMEYPVPD